MKSFLSSHKRSLMLISVFALTMVAMVAPAAAQTAEPVALNIDLNPLFDNINTYIPVFFGIFAIPGGIAIAIVLVRFIINAVRGAFEGKSV